MGCLDQAVARIQQAVTIAQDLGHPFSLGYARCFAAAIHQGRGEAPMTFHHAEQALVLAQAQGFPHLRITGTLLQGWALATHGQYEEGIAQFQQALVEQKHIDFEVGRSFYLAQLAEVHCALGQWEQGVVSVAEGLERVRDKGEWFYAADLYRFKGELILQTGAGGWGRGVGDQKNLGFHVQSSPLQTSHTQHLAPSTQEKREQEAEACFLQAIDIARTQTTKLFELRTTMSLCRLWHAQGKTQRARQRLAETVGWFTEGFDTPELQKAHALLMTFH